MNPPVVVEEDDDATCWLSSRFFPGQNCLTHLRGAAAAALVPPSIQIHEGLGVCVWGGEVTSCTNHQSGELLIHPRYWHTCMSVESETQWTLIMLLMDLLVRARVRHTTVSNVTVS